MKPNMKYLIVLLFSSTACAVSANAQNAGAQNASSVTGSMSVLRNAKIAAVDKPFFVSDLEKQGTFVPDLSDKASPDDSVMTLVTADGFRFKRIVDNGILNARWFGAKGNGGTDDWYPLQKAINYILSHPYGARTLYLPPGTYSISRPLIIAKIEGNVFKQTSINLAGPANSKSLSSGFATIAPSFNNSFAIGIQLGKGIQIKDVQIIGRFTLPDKLTAVQIDTLSASEWTDGVSRDNPLSPYAGIVVDPFCDAKAFEKPNDMYPGLEHYYPKGAGRGGSSSIQITGCAIRNFIVGVMLTPSNQQNADLVDVIDCDISSNKVGYAMGQAQSKECHVERLKCWGPTHTLFDNMGYGFRHGDGANIPLVDGVNIASHIKQLCRINATSFSGVFRNVYAEGLFRIGYVGGAASVSFEDCQLNFETKGPNTPYPDFYVLGSGVTFRNCMLRSYMGGTGYRLVLSGTNNHYEGGVMNEPPVAFNVSDGWNYPNPSFSNILLFYSGGILGSSNQASASAASSFLASNGMGTDPIYFGNTYIFRNAEKGIDVLYKMTYQDTYERTVQLGGTPVIHIDRSSWTGYFKLARASDISYLQEGDFLLTTGLHYQDQFAYLQASTYPVGIIQNIGHDTVYLRNIAVGIHDGMALGLVSDYYVRAAPPFTGDMAAGSNMITRVQGILPAVGERPDIPMTPVGTYVTAIDKAAGTIRLSNLNTSGQSFKDYTFFNGYPEVDMYSCYDIPTLLKNQKTFIAGSRFHHLAAPYPNFHVRQYPGSGIALKEYKILHTVIAGDTSLHKFKAILLSEQKEGNE